MAIQTERAFVLKSFDFRETSKIATLFTENSGKIKGIFKGIRAGKKNFTTNLGLGTLNEIVYYPSRSDLWLVSYADLLPGPFLTIDNLDVTTVLNYILELVDKIMPMHAASKAIFDLIEQTLLALNDKAWEVVIYVFQAKLLELSGFRPSLNQCTWCFCDLRQDALFSSKTGGLVCENCSPAIKDCFRLSREVLISLRYIQENDFSFALRLKPSAKARYEMRKILDDFFIYHTNTKIRSMELMLLG